jgi:cytochrome c oxidase subunit 3
MMFAAFTSAYVVRKAAGNWLEFQLPSGFYFSTAVILLSSLTLYLSFSNFKKGNEVLYKSLLVISFVLGLAFVFLQYFSWTQMFDYGITLDGNPSGSFVYVISGAHAVHVLGGIACFVVALIHAFNLPFRVTKKRIHRFELINHYWHFVGLLWVYLLIFLLN